MGGSGGIRVLFKAKGIIDWRGRGREFIVDVPGEVGEIGDSGSFWARTPALVQKIYTQEEYLSTSILL